MKYLSVCSGIEAASAAWHPLGWEPLAFSEIEAFPRAVLAHHYPDVPCYGDFTQLRDHMWIEDADVLVGGTPCQAFSVAGLRKSLSDDRGNLSLEFVRLADAIDNIRRDRGKRPCVVVWENVPGVLSVKDNAFGCFLAALAGDVEPYIPPRGKWTNAGVVDGPERTVAWRILDAQYFGLAQRRRRVFVVASAREGFDPAAVLLEFEGVRRDTPPRREAGKAASGGAGAGAPVGFQSSQSGVRLVDTHATLDANNGPRRHNGVMVKADASLSHWDGSEHPHPTLNQSAKASGGVGASNQELFSQRGAYLVGDVTTARMVAFGEYVDDGTASTLKQRDYKDATDLVAHTLKGEDFDGSEDGTGRGTPLVPVAVPDVAGTMKSCAQSGGWSNSADHAAAGYMVPVQAFYSTESRCDNFPPPDVSPPLKVGSNGGGQPPAIAFSAKDHGGDATEDLSPTLRAMPHNESHANGGGQMAVAVPLQEVGKRTGVSTDDPRAGIGIGEDGDPMFTLQAGAQHGVAVEPYTLAIRGRGDTHNLEARQDGLANALPTPNGGRAGIGVGAVAAGMAVRRLTPVECERLQGFPDNYTLISWKKKRASECPDGPRYKALGNSMAVPVMRWIGKRIAEQME